MPRPGLAALLAAAAGLAACATTAPHGGVDVILSSGPGSPEEARLVRAVEDAVSTGHATGPAFDPWAAQGERPAGAPAPSATGLVCTPYSGEVLLRCTPATFGSEGQTVTVVVSRLGGGYQVTIEQSWLLPGRESAVCGLQQRVTRAINAELPGTARADARSGCKE